MVRALFQSGHEVAHVHLGHVHSNVCGPMEVTSLGKNCYFCTLIDDKTQLIWFHPCKSKSSFTPWFIHMDKLFANQYGTHVKILRSNGGGEYVNTVLCEYCGENGICIELTVPHMPEQNSVAKRTNQKILDKGRTIMKDARAPDFLWAKAFTTTVYAINRTISANSGGVTPFKVFSSWKPDIGHMRVWYSDVFTHQPKELGSRKLGERGHLVKFLGYPKESSGYKVYEPTTHEVYIVCKPVFREEAQSSRPTTFESTSDNSEPDENPDQNEGDALSNSPSITPTTPIPSSSPPIIPAPTRPT